MKITYRPLTTKDEPFLWEMLYQAIYIPEGEPPAPREIVYQADIRRYVEGWGQKDDRGWLALEDQHPVGAAWLRMLIGANSGFGYVDEKTPELSIAVLPSWRGRGIGTQLLRRLLSDAQKRYTAVCLSVSPENPARCLYQRLGFKPVKARDLSITMLKQWRSR